MAKLILISVIGATIIIPIRTAREKSPVLGLKRALLLTALFDVAYLLAMLLIYPRVV